ncbi:MAG: hypothetical protein UU95_C0022G0006 [Parcubacteria group bacterium GW2011_GWC2_42_12]|nr:MAG: hypothetical protein UU95_C0022G0006 [Parcubacteria group bacterium GW2011_GWC2_42_12]
MILGYGKNKKTSGEFREFFYARLDYWCLTVRLNTQAKIQAMTYM